MIEKDGGAISSLDFDDLTDIAVSAVEFYRHKHDTRQKALADVFNDALERHCALLAASELKPERVERGATEAANREVAAAARAYSNPEALAFPAMVNERMLALRSAFGLGEFEVFVLIYAAASLHRYEVFTFNQSRLESVNSTPHLISSVFVEVYGSSTYSECLVYFGVERALRSLGLIELSSDQQHAGNFFHSSLVIDEHITNYLLGGNELPSQVKGFISTFEPPSGGFYPTQKEQAALVARAWKSEAAQSEGTQSQTNRDWPVVQLLHRSSAVMFETKANIAMQALVSLIDTFLELRLDLVGSDLTVVLKFLNREVKLRRFALIIDASKLIGVETADALVTRFVDGFDGPVLVCAKEAFEFKREVQNVFVTKRSTLEQRRAWAAGLSRGLRQCVPCLPQLQTEHFPDGIPLEARFERHHFPEGGVPKVRLALRNRAEFFRYPLKNAYKYWFRDGLKQLIGQYDLDEVVQTRAARLAASRFETWLLDRLLPEAALLRYGDAAKALQVAQTAWRTVRADQPRNGVKDDLLVSKLDTSFEDMEITALEEGEEVVRIDQQDAPRVNPVSLLEDWQRDVLHLTPLDEAEVQLRLNTLIEFAWEAVKEIVMPRVGKMAERIKPTAQWDQLVLPRSEMFMLETMVAHVNQRQHVYGDWGFHDASSYGFGITGLFSGPSGTGKTFAAEVLGKRLNLDLIKVDLSSVVSKYIGETEKNLSKVFDAAESGGAILFFDEGDALFGKRGEVSDSTDRYANMEVAYLLQRMEQFRGLAILTTNLENSLDSAFLRRLRFVVRFKVPEKSERVQIWQRAFPGATPLGPMDWDAIGNWEFSGGNIRNTALNAAFAAASASDGPKMVLMQHIYNAALMEIRKLKRFPRDEEVKGWEIFARGTVASSSEALRTYYGKLQAIANGETVPMEVSPESNLLETDSVAQET